MKDELHQEKEFLLKETYKLQNCLIAAYDEYGGLTSRRIIDKFYQYFVEHHKNLLCEAHDSLFSNKSKNEINKMAVSDHWLNCPNLNGGRKQFFDEFGAIIGNINHYFNKYVHRNSVKEIIIPSDCESEILHEIYNREKDKLENELNNDGELKIIQIKKYENPSEQIKKFYFYKMA